MAFELDPGDFGVARLLFADLGALQLSACAVIDGESDGRLLVDDPAAPTAALMITPEGALLAGDPENEGFNAALHRFVRGELFARLGWRGLYATVDAAGWEDKLASLAAPGDLDHIRRLHYVCREARLEWRALVPDGYGVRRIDGDLLDDASLTVPDHIRGWIASNWHTQERFLERGFGFVTVGEGAVVSWSLADCRCGDACEIGIHTLEAFRRHGLATITAAAAVEHALTSGYRSVGWHCNEDNLGSIGTAEKAGFKLERRYRSHYFRSPLGSGTGP